jgi:hypothetical protein
MQQFHVGGITLLTITCLTEYMVLHGYTTHWDVFSKVGTFTSAFTFTFYSAFVAVACRGFLKLLPQPRILDLYAIHVVFFIGVTVVWIYIK